MLKSNSNIGVWLFKSYTVPRQVRISRSVYLLAQLIGISTPLIHEITLSVNGEIVHGSIQEFFSGAERVKDIKLYELNNKQIAEIHKCQIFSWLIFNKDSGRKHLIIHPKTKCEYKSNEKYLEAIKMNTLSGRHHYVLGLAYLVKGDKEMVKQHFDKAREFGYKVDIKSKKTAAL